MVPARGIENSARKGPAAPRITSMTATTKPKKPSAKKASKVEITPTLLSRHIDGWRAPAIPQLTRPDMDKATKKRANDAKVLLMCVLEHNPRFQVTKQRIHDETGLSQARITKAMQFLDELNMAAYASVRKDARMYGWCILVDLNGAVERGKCVLHYSQERDERYDYGKAKKIMRRKKAGLDFASSKTQKAQKAQKQGGSDASPLHPYIDEPVGYADSKPPSPLSGGDFSKLPKASGKKKKPATRSDPDEYEIPPTPNNAPAEALANHLLESNINVRLKGAIDAIDTRRMSDQEVQAWWKINIPGRLLDDCLPPGQSYTPKLMRVHMRRLKRTPRYLDCLAWHWATTRRSTRRMTPEVLTTDIQRLYCLSDRHDEQEGTMDQFALTHAYRYTLTVNGKTWNEHNPTSLSGVPFITDLSPLPSDDEMLQELGDIDTILLHAELALQAKQLTNPALDRLFRLRAWAVGRMGSHDARAVEARCRKFSLTPGTNPMLAHWCVTTEVGRRCFRSFIRFRPVTGGYTSDAVVRWVFGFTTDEWDLGISDHAARCHLLQDAYENLQWQQKSVRDYAVW